MSNLENANFPRPVSPQSPWTWGFMDTALISLIAYGVYTLVSGLTLTILAVPDGAKTLSPAQFQADGAAYIIACPLTVVVLWIAIRNARRDFAEYLALNWPSSGELLRALAITAILLLAESLAIYVVGAEEVSPDAYASATQPGRFLIFLIGGCIAAPIMEEFLFRGTIGSGVFVSSPRVWLSAIFVGAAIRRG
jgi:uncharacterized protein